jgi:hypothetical protein
MSERIKVSEVWVSYKEKTTKYGASYGFKELEFRSSLKDAPISKIHNIHVYHTVGEAEQTPLRLEYDSEHALWKVFQVNEKREHILYFTFSVEDDRMLIDEFKSQLRDILFPLPPGPDAQVTM